MRVMGHYDRDPKCDLVLFAEAVTRDPFFLVGREPKPDFSFRDLAGIGLATVSEVPTPWLCLQEDLRRAGVPPESVARVADKTMEENAAALRAGSLDVIQVFEPYVETLLAEGVGHIWHAAATRGLTAYTSFYTLRPTLEARREEFVKMTRALYRAEQWLKEADATAAGEALAEWFPELPPEVLAGSVARYKSLGVWNHEPVLSREGFDRLKAGLISGGWVATGTSYDVCVETAIAEEVVAEGPPPPTH